MRRNRILGGCASLSRIIGESGKINKEEYGGGNSAPCEDVTYAAVRFYMQKMRYPIGIIGTQWGNSAVS
jgi:hypothetical protein